MASKPYNMVDLESGYAEYLKQYKDTNDGISYWESLLMAPTKQYESSLKQATATRDYDISGAYANWKQNQLKLIQSSRLGTGVKSEIGSSLQSAYENQYAQAQQQWYSDLTKASQVYAKDVQSAESEINTMAEQLAKVTPKVLEMYAEKHDLDYSEFYKAFYSKEHGGYGIYDEETGGLSDFGRQVFDEVLNQYITEPLTDEKGTPTGEFAKSFVDWLGEQGGYEDFIDLYKKPGYQQMVASALGGERSRDLYYSGEEQSEDYVKNEATKSPYYDKERKFDSYEQEEQFYKDLDDMLNRIDTEQFFGAKDFTKDWASIVEDYYGTKQGVGSGIDIRGTNDGRGVTIWLRDNKNTDISELEKLGFTHKKGGSSYAGSSSITITDKNKLKKLLSDMYYLNKNKS